MSNTTLDIPDLATTVATDKASTLVTDISKESTKFLPIATSQTDSTVAASGKTTTDKTEQPAQPVQPAQPLPASNSDNIVNTVNRNATQALPASNSDNSVKTEPTINTIKQDVSQPPLIESTSLNNQSIPDKLPIVTERTPIDSNVEIKPANEVTEEPSKTVEYFLTYALTETVIDDKTTQVLKTQTFAAIRPISTKSVSTGLEPITLLLILCLLTMFK